MSGTHDLKRLLELRKNLKSKKPEFLRHLWWKKPKFKNDPKWRKPKGLDNKMRLRLKGYPSLVEIGYRGPRKVRGLHPSGKKSAIVNSIKDLNSLDPATHVLYIGSSVGLKKRMEIIEIALRKGFKVANASSLELARSKELAASSGETR